MCLITWGIGYYVRHRGGVARFVSIGPQFYPYALIPIAAGMWSVCILPPT